MLVPSLGKSVYYVSFIYDFSRNTWIYFLMKKYKVFDRFKEFKSLAENQIEKIIKVLRTDNGREFCRNEFEELCKKCGISRKITTPYTPQQNGVAERMNRMLMEKERCMLSGVGIGVITEISSAQGDKNSASSAQKNSHSWHKD